MVITIDCEYIRDVLRGYENKSPEYRYAVLFNKMQIDVDLSLDVYPVDEWLSFIKVLPNYNAESTGIRATLNLIIDTTSDSKVKSGIEQLLLNLEIVYFSISRAF